MTAATFDVDYCIIGSGFGGSVSALRLAEKGYSVCVLERGRRFAAADFPRTNWNLGKSLWMPALKCFGILRLSVLSDVFVLSGAGVGGGSLVYANTLYVPPDAFFQAAGWADLADVPLFLLEEGCSYTDDFLDELHRRTGRTGPVTRFGSIEAARACVEEGLGLSVLPRVAVAANLGRSLVGITRPRLPDAPLGLLHDPRRWQSPAATAVARVLRTADWG